MEYIPTAMDYIDCLARLERTLPWPWALDEPFVWV